MTRHEIWSVAWALLLAAACDAAPAPTTAQDGDGGGGDVPTETGGDAAGLDADGTSPPAAEIADVCAVPQWATLVGDVAVDLVSAGMWVVQMSHDQDMGYAVTAAGTSRASLGVVSFQAPCDAQTWFDPYCEAGEEGEPEQVLASCLQIGCEGPGVYLTKAYLSDPTAADKNTPHPVTYPLELVGGQATYASNPVTTWRIDTNPMMLGVTAQLQRSLSVTLDGGVTGDLSFSAQLELAKAKFGGVTAFYVTAGFPNVGLGADGQLTLSVALDDELHPAGELKVGDMVVGTFSMGDTPGDPIQWQCPPER